MILIAIGIIGYLTISSGNGFTGMNVVDNPDTHGNLGEEKSPEDKISQEVKNLIEESGSEKITILVKQKDIERVSENVEKIGGEVKGDALDYIAIEIPADKE